MSLSVNNYYQKYYNNYDLTSGGTDPSKTASAAAGLTSAAGTDSASFSDIAKLFFNLDDESSDSAEDYTATYTPAMMRPAPQPLSSDQMKSLLEEIQTNTSVSGSGTASSSSTDNTLTSLQSLLGGYDLSSADNDEISALFQSVQSLPFSLSYADTAAADSQSSGQASGIPTMLQAMGGFPPPFAWGLNHTAAGTDETAATEAVTASTGSVQATGLTSLESGLTKEDIQSILATLQSSLSLPGGGDEASASTDNPLSAVIAMLSKTNFMASSDSELSSLFSNILQKLA
jgi:hypothetical protein